MSRTLQFKRYANTFIASSITGANGELIIDSTNRTITVHDGVTLGGKRLATETFVSNATSSVVLVVNQIVTNSSNRSNNAVLLANQALILAQAASNSTNTLLISLSSNSVFTSITSNNYFSNTGVDLFAFANAAYSQANVSSGTAAFNQANTANLIANTAAANITIIFGIDAAQNTNIASAWTQANAANVLAQSSYTQANAANVLAQSSYTQANSANILAQAAFTQANSANILAQAAFTQANTSAQTVPQNAQVTNYILQLSDAGKHIYYTQSSNVILYIPTTANVAFSNGTKIMIVSKTSSSANVTVSPNTGVSMFLAGNTISASRNVTTYGVATLMQVAANTWFISGTGVV